MICQRMLKFVIIALVCATGTYFVVFIDLTSRRSCFSTLNGVTIDVDLVITYVNGSEKEWREKFLNEVEKARGQLLPFSATRNRFQDHEDLRYLLRSVDTFGRRFFRRIYLVVATESQVPLWLNLRHPRLHIVYHRDIFYNERDLPTFNSLAIEANLHHIDGLAEYYIYANDDLAFLNPIQLSDYVGAIDPDLGTIQSLIVRPNRKIHIRGLLPNISSPFADYMNPAMHARDLVLALLAEGSCEGANTKRVVGLLENIPSHTPKLFVRSIFVQAERNERILNALNRTSSQKFRSGREIDAAQFFTAYAECTSSVEVLSLDEDGLLYVALDEGIVSTFALDSALNRLEKMRAEALYSRRRRTAQFLCVNDVTAAPMPTEFGVAFSRNVQNLRDILFPRRSALELA